jgi:predicted transcriptional regulator
MKKKRDRLEVIYDILNVIRSKNGTIKPTHILYKSNLSHQMMEEYLGDLINRGFVEEKKAKDDRRTYSLTPKGFEYLNQYRYISDFMTSFGLAEQER